MSSSLTADFNQKPSQIVKSSNRDVFCFLDNQISTNIDNSVVESFGEEWIKFNQFSDAEISKMSNMYFDILNEEIINKNTYGIDIGCGTGRWTKVLAGRIKFMEAIDPSDAIFAADKLLADKDNVRLSKASTDNIPFADETFDFGMSVGVLHHIPDTQKAMNDCVKKIKIGGYFYTYLYYDFAERGVLFKTIFKISNVLRKLICNLPSGLKKFMCDLIAIFIYMPFVLLGRLFKAAGLKSIARKIPLNFYQDQSFFIIRNDALDRFGTSLEQRFSKTEVENMMKTAGLSEINISPNLPYWHAVGKRTR